MTSKWKIQNGMNVSLFWVNWRNRGIYTRGVIVGFEDGGVFIGDSLSTPMDRAKMIDVTRIREIEVIKESAEGKAFRLAFAKPLAAAAASLRAPSFDPADLLKLADEIKEAFGD